METGGVMNAGTLLVVTLATPLAMLLACVSPQLRDRMPALLAFAPLPALIAALLAPSGSSLVMPPGLLGMTLVLDTPGAMLLGVAALLWIAAGAYAGADLRGRPTGGRFAVWWLMTLTGNIGVFMAADLQSFYLFFTLVSLAAYGLIVHDDTPASRRAAAVTLALAVLGEAFLLMGFVLLAAAAPGGSLLISDAVAALPTSPWRDSALTLLILGFGLKIGLVPLHVWMPLAYSAAPTSAAAVLSGAAVKAGVIGLIRFLPLETALPGWGEALVAAGLFSAFYGVAIGLTQANPRTVLAYSSVSQMGLLAAVLGMGLATGDPTVRIAAAFYAVHHVLAKGGLFLAVGVVALTRSRSLWPVLLPATIVALGLAGLPLTGGALAKLAVKGPLGDGIVGMLVMLSAIASTILMLHFVRRLLPITSQPSRVAAPGGLVLPWLAIALASVVVPWTLYPEIANASWRDALAPNVLWEAVVPVLIGAAMSYGLRRWEYLLPRIPEGDLLEMAKIAARATRNLSAAMEQIDRYLRQWPVAGVLLLGLTIILAGTMLAGR
jgi:formate hydrogenlyase subunit 3/multisubunit Na+/H+ antiporter MnhD subunit